MNNLCERQYTFQFKSILARTYRVHSLLFGALHPCGCGPHTLISNRCVELVSLAYRALLYLTRLSMPLRYSTFFRMRVSHFDR
jgi:hypothetical protein